MLLHGIPGSALTWSEVARRLEPRHRVLAPDLIGFGSAGRAADAAALAPPAQAVRLERELDARGVRGAVVVGHDYGGPVALALAERRPDLVSGLVLSATNAFPDTPVPMPIRLVTWPVLGGVFERVLFSRASLALMTRGVVPTDDRGERRSTRLIFASSLRLLRERYEPTERTLTSTRVPVLVCWGDRDPFFPLAQGERTAAAAREGELRVYRGCGHFVPVERPAEFAADIARFAAGERAAA